MNKHLFTRATIAAVLAFGSSALVVGCGDDDEDGGGGGANCSSCPADAQTECNDGYNECINAGESASTCQSVAQEFCDIMNGLADAGFGIGGSGGSGGGTGGAPDGG